MSPISCAFVWSCFKCCIKLCPGYLYAFCFPIYTYKIALLRLFNLCFCVSCAFICRSVFCSDVCNSCTQSIHLSSFPDLLCKQLAHACLLLFSIGSFCFLGYVVSLFNTPDLFFHYFPVAAAHDNGLSTISIQLLYLLHLLSSGTFLSLLNSLYFRIFSFDLEWLVTQGFRCSLLFIHIVPSVSSSIFFFIHLLSLSFGVLGFDW